MSTHKPTLEKWYEQRGAWCSTTTGSIPDGFSVDGEPFTTHWVNETGVSITITTTEMDVPADYIDLPVDPDYAMRAGAGVVGLSFAQ